MVLDTDSEMAANTTFSSILNEIQLSNLNFAIKLTPFAAYITLKKSAQKTMNGDLVTPSPPLLFILQETQQRNLELHKENSKLKAVLKELETKYDIEVHENTSHMDMVEEANLKIAALNDRINILHNTLEEVEKENTLNVVKAKGAKKKHVEEVNELKLKIKTLDKTIKSKEKETHNLTKTLGNTRDTLKNMKAEKAQLKTSKTKLETTIRRLEKDAEIHVKGYASEKLDENKNTTANLPSQLSGPKHPDSCPPTSLPPESASSTLSSIVSHSNPFLQSKSPLDEAADSNSNNSCIENTENEYKNIELEEKEEGFIGPRLPRVMTDDEFNAFLKRLLGDKYSY